MCTCGWVPTGPPAPQMLNEKPMEHQRQYKQRMQALQGLQGPAPTWLGGDPGAAWGTTGMQAAASPAAKAPRPGSLLDISGLP